MKEDLEIIVNCKCGAIHIIGIHAYFKHYDIDKTRFNKKTK